MCLYGLRCAPGDCLCNDGVVRTTTQQWKMFATDVDQLETGNLG